MAKPKYLIQTTKKLKKTHAQMIRRFGIPATAKDTHITFLTNDIEPIKKLLQKVGIDLYLVPKKSMRLTAIIEQEPIT